MKVIFLDFDGVLNSEKYLRAQNEHGVIIDPSRMALLKQIVDKTGARIVLSTSWREHWSKSPDQCNETGRAINRIFEGYGLQIVDKTPKLCSGREDEIKAWLDRHPSVTNFVVLDDGFLGADFLKNRFVKTSKYKKGLDEEEVKKAIEILKG